MLAWAELRDRYLGSPETVEVDGPSGRTYQVKTHAVWDGKKGGDLRVLVEGDDGGWRAFLPLVESFTVAPGGSFGGSDRGRRRPAVGPGSTLFA